jgi:hypothetical protein
MRDEVKTQRKWGKVKRGRVERERDVKIKPLLCFSPLPI